MEPSRPFNKYTHCTGCKRYIDEVKVKLKRIVTSGDTYRQFSSEYLDSLPYQRLCTDCVAGIHIPQEGNNDSQR